MNALGAALGLVALGLLPWGRRVQKLAESGKYPCPGHTEPNIEVGPSGIELDGRTVASGRPR